MIKRCLEYPVVILYLQPEMKSSLPGIENREKEHGDGG